MDDLDRTRRRYAIMVGISAVFLLAAVVQFFRQESGLLRWVLVLTWTGVTFTLWKLRRALRTAPGSRA